MTQHRPVIVAAAEEPYTRHPGGTSTTDLLTRAFFAALERTTLTADDVDGIGVSSFSLRPDHVIDLAWRLGLPIRWLMEDPTGGASGINLLQHAIRAIEGGDARTIVLLAGDHLTHHDFAQLVSNYNVATRDWLAPLPHGGPNTLFAHLTQRHMQRYGLHREDYGALVIAQRAWAGANPGAVYRTPLTIGDYLNAPPVAPPLGRYDCVPVVAGADALIITRDNQVSGPTVRVRASAALHNPDNQEGDGLTTGLSAVAGEIWDQAGIEPADIDMAAIYDDYPAMACIQLADLGFAPDGDLHRLLHTAVATGRLPLNTSGGQLSAGQAGAAGGMHGLVEATTQLRHTAGQRQVPNARLALVTGYGMVTYRYGSCSNAVILERHGPGTQQPREDT